MPVFRSLLALALCAEGAEAAKASAQRTAASKAVASLTQKLGNGIGDVKPYDLEGIENSLLAMATSKDARATPGLPEFLDQIWSLTTQMKAQILTQSNITQTALTKSWEAYLSCEYLEEGHSIGHASEVHTACRQSEATLYGECIILNNTEKHVNETRATWEELVSTYMQGTGCAYPGGTSAIEFMRSTRDHFRHLSNEFRTQFKAYEEAKVEEEEAMKSFRARWQRYTAKKAACDDKQAELERMGCGEGDPKCRQYLDCYETKHAEWLSQNTTATSEYDMFSTEYRGVLRIECLLDAFRRSDQGQETLDEGINRCKETIHIKTTDAALGFIWYPNTNAPDPGFHRCNGTQHTSTPGSHAWSTEFYSGLPTLAPAAECNAGCCVHMGP
eukprot:gb/GFBE01080141.1/.p1 GENE.gb/GFBE01080141.1/~~gb/GFBE01080141.1/.p1  ORF type:complete len:388 (+),score=89.76 gb/GFBE01080141.1/:1-1164(+)